MDKKLEKLFNDYHVVSCKMLLENGYTKYQIMNLVKKGFLYRVRKGLYRLHNEIDDEFHIYQKNNSYIVYSNETALYLHNAERIRQFPNPMISIVYNF